MAYECLYPCVKKLWKEPRDSDIKNKKMNTFFFFSLSPASGKNDSGR